MKFPFGVTLVLYAGAAFAGDGGPLRDIGWGASVADDGIAYVPFDIGGSMDDRATAAALQPDGRLVIGGYAAASSSNQYLAMTRTTSAQGTSDPEFGTNGKLRLDASTDQISDVAVLSDGGIVYAAKTSQSTLVIGRLLSDGTADSSFNGNGRRLMAATAFISAGSLLARPKIVIQPDGKIVVFTGAEHTIPDPQLVAAATRLNTDGSTDTTFGGQGTGYGAYAPPNGATSEAVPAAVVRLTNGQFLVAGFGMHDGGSGSDAIIFRLSADGVLDTTYGNGGYAFVAFDLGGTLDDYATGMAIDSAGRAVISLNITDAQGRPRAALARLTSAGQLDSSFGVGGRVQYEARASSSAEYSNSVAVLPDGRILVAGTSTLCGCGGQPDAGILTLFTSAGQVIPYFGESGTEYFGTADGPDSQILEIASMVVSGDYVYVVGRAHNPAGTDNNDFASARVLVPLFRSGFETVVTGPP